MNSLCECVFGEFTSNAHDSLNNVYVVLTCPENSCDEVTNGGAHQYFKLKRETIEMEKVSRRRRKGKSVPTENAIAMDLVANSEKKSQENETEKDQSELNFLANTTKFN